MVLRDAARATIEARREQTRQLLVNRRRLSRSAVYAGQNQLQSLGGEPVPARNRQRKTSLSRREPISAVQGLIAELGDTGVSSELFEATVQKLREEFQRIANRRGVLLFQGDVTNPGNDPNDIANGGNDRAYQRFDNQLLYTGTRTEAGDLYVHLEANATEPEIWQKVQANEELNGYIESPSQGQVYPIIPSAFYDSTVASIHIRAGADSTTVTADGVNTAVAGSTTVQLNYAVGATVATGDRVTLTPTATDGTALEFTIGFLR